MYEKKDLESKLLHSLLNNGMYDMLDIFYKETHCPINFFTSNFKAIKFAPDQEIGDYIWDNILKSEIIPPDIMKFLSDKELIKKGYLSKNAFAVPKDKNMVRPRAVGVVASKNKIIGYLTVYYTSEVTAEDLELLNTLSKMMSLSFSNVKNSPTQVKSLYGAFFAALFEGQIKQEAELLQWQRRMDIDFQPDYIVLCIKPEKTNEQSILPYLLEQLSGYDPLDKYFIANDCLYFVISQISSPRDINKKIRGIVSSLRPYQIKAGISQIYNDLLLSSYYQEQAHIACNHSNNYHIVSYNQCIFDEMIARLMSTKNKQLLVHPVFGALKEYDQKNNTEYFHTLITYLKCLGKSGEIIKNLGIHRNTLPSRIRFIEELGDLDLNDYTTLAMLTIGAFLEYYCADCIVKE